MRYLQQLGVSLLIGEEIMQTLHTQLENGLPLLVAVDTSQLTYWDAAADHAVVVTGIDNKQVFLNDPDLPKPYQKVPLAEFELAWLEKDYLYAVIQLVS